MILCPTVSICYLAKQLSRIKDLSLLARIDDASTLSKQGCRPWTSPYHAIISVHVVGPHVSNQTMAVGVQN